MAAAEDGRRATVVVDGLDIVYRVVGGGRRGTTASEEQGLLARLRRQEQPSSVREVHAVKDVSFVAYHGESIGIIGRNGSGKSTLLRAVAGLIPPTRGRLWVSGEPSLLGVNAVLMSQLSGERNIYIGGQALGLSRQQIRERFDDIVDFSGIGDAVYRPMRTYSSGMGARLRFAISTSAAPDVLMIDEALATGDADFRERSAARIAEIRKTAGTVFLVSHSNSNIRQICDRVLWLDQGRLVMDGPTEEVLQAYEETLPKRQRRKAKGEGRRPSEPPVEGVPRIPGQNRIETLAALTSRTHPDSVEGAFVVPSRGISSMVAVAPLAARLGWPVLLTHKGNAPGSTSDQLARLQPGRVVLVGTEDEVSPQVEEQLRKLLEGDLVRVSERSRAALGRRLLEETDQRPGLGTVRVVSADARPVVIHLAVAAALEGTHLLVVDDTGLDEETLQVLRDLAPEAFRVGQDPAQLPAGVLDALGELAPVEREQVRGPLLLSVERNARRATHPDRAYVSALTASHEALGAALAGARTGDPVLFVLEQEIPDAVHKTLERLQPREIVVVGDPGRLSTRVRQDLAAYVRTEG